MDGSSLGIGKPPVVGRRVGPGAWTLRRSSLGRVAVRDDGHAASAVWRAADRQWVGEHTLRLWVCIWEKIQ